MTSRTRSGKRARELARVDSAEAPPDEAHRASMALVERREPLDEPRDGLGRRSDVAPEPRRVRVIAAVAQEPAERARRAIVGEEAAAARAPGGRRRARAREARGSAGTRAAARATRALRAGSASATAARFAPHGQHRCRGAGVKRESVHCAKFLARSIVEYRSKAVVLGLPLVHMATGRIENRHLSTWGSRSGGSRSATLRSGRSSRRAASRSAGSPSGSSRSARLVLGGGAIGAVAIGGAAAGVLAVGGAAFALVGAFGGLAVARDAAIGGVAFAAHAERRGRARGDLAVALPDRRRLAARARGGSSCFPAAARPLALDARATSARPSASAPGGDTGRRRAIGERCRRRFRSIAEIVGPILARVPREHRAPSWPWRERLAARRYRGWAADPANCGAQGASRGVRRARGGHRDADRGAVSGRRLDRAPHCSRRTPDLEEIDRRFFAGQTVRRAVRDPGAGQSASDTSPGAPLARRARRAPPRCAARRVRCSKRRARRARIHPRRRAERRVAGHVGAGNGRRAPCSTRRRAHFRRHGWIHLPQLPLRRRDADLVAWTDEIAAWPETPGTWMRYYEKRHGRRAARCSRASRTSCRITRAGGAAHERARARPARPSAAASRSSSSRTRSTSSIQAARDSRRIRTIPPT